VVTDVSKEQVIKTGSFSEMSGVHFPVTHLHVPEDQNALDCKCG
jgi:hypothetical protein